MYVPAATPCTLHRCFASLLTHSATRQNAKPSPIRSIERVHHEKASATASSSTVTPAANAQKDIGSYSLERWYDEAPRLQPYNNIGATPFKSLTERDIEMILIKGNNSLN